MAGTRYRQATAPRTRYGRRSVGAALIVLGVVALTLGVGTTPALAATATLVTAAQASVPFGSSIADTAVVLGEAQAPIPTGTVTFTLFGPGNPTCTGAPVFTSAPQTVAGPTASGPFTPTAPGTYLWIAAYSGDANYTPVSSPCGKPDQVSVVAPGVAQMATFASSSANLGGPISDTAIVVGSPGPVPAPTGTVTFTLFGPFNPTCTGTPIFTSAPASLNNQNTAVSGPFTPPAAGLYNWVAVYNGDANYPSISGFCGASGESSFINPVAPTITTQAAGPVGLSGQLSDTATVAGPLQAATPTGTVTFTLFGPANPTCTGNPIFTSAANALAAGNASSGSFPPPAIGIYNWVAAYSGDLNYLPAISPCGAPGETALVVTALPTISVDETAAPSQLPEPGGDFTFDIVVTNTSAENLTITALTDDVYGNLATLGTCTTAIGTVLIPSGTFSCSFTGAFTGGAGASQTDTVTVTATDPGAIVASDTDEATVTIGDVDPTITVDLTVDPASRPAPGGTFTFTVLITNTGDEAVTLVSLTDDVYGNLANRGTCSTALGTVLAPDATYSCTYSGDFTGAAGATQANTVTAVAVDDDDVVLEQAAPAGDDGSVTAAGLDAAEDTATISIVAAQVVTTSTTSTTSTTAPPVVRGSALPRTGGGAGGLLGPAGALFLVGGVLLVTDELARRRRRPAPAHARR